MPEAAVIMVVGPSVANLDRWTVKLRLGKNAPPGLTLHSLRITDWHPQYGGRWNAGSNGRGGGTTIESAWYANRLRARLQEATMRITRVMTAGLAALPVSERSTLTLRAEVKNAGTKRMRRIERMQAQPQRSPLLQKATATTPTPRTAVTPTTDNCYLGSPRRDSERTHPPHSFGALMA